MKTAPLLTFSIPTYNRAGLLKEALDALFSQIDLHAAMQVEVLILDNASSDGTAAVVHQMQADFSHVIVRYIRHPENIGPDANFYEGVNRALGKFVYLLSDDDILLPGAVAKMIYLLETYPEFDAIALNVCEFWDHPDENKQGVFRISADQIMPTCDEALIFLNTHIGFMSCMAVRRENISLKDYTDKLKTNFAHIYFFLDGLLPSRGFYATSKPYLAQRAGNAGGFDVFKVTVTNFYAAMQYAQQIGYSHEAVSQVMTKHLDFLCHLVKSFKSKNVGTLQPNYWDGAVRLLRTYGLNGVVLFNLIPLMMLPRFLYRHLRLIYKGIKTRLSKPSIQPHASSVR